MPFAVMPDLHGDGAPLVIVMVKKDKPPVLCNKRGMWTYGKAWKDF